MTKSETREVLLTIKYFEAGLGADYLARALSSLIRAARSTKSHNELMAVAIEHGVVDHPEFIC
jgi:hypothetical protein